MSAARIQPSVWGADLTTEDEQNLAKRWIPRELAEQAGIRRVDSQTGLQMCGRKRGDFSGLIIPNRTPWSPLDVREYRLRLDFPGSEYRSDGSIRESRKYIQPPGRGNIIYFPPGFPLSALEDTNLPLIITEGEFKAPALWRLAGYNSETLRFAPIALAGVNNFRGNVGKTIGPTGKRQDVKGVIPDFDRLKVKVRPVIIAYDADCENKPQVRSARWKLNSVLAERSALVGLLEWPIQEKGIDDRLYQVGPEAVLRDMPACNSEIGARGFSATRTGRFCPVMKTRRSGLRIRLNGQAYSDITNSPPAMWC